MRRNDGLVRIVSALGASFKALTFVITFASFVFVIFAVIGMGGEEVPKRKDEDMTKYLVSVRRDV